MAREELINKIIDAMSASKGKSDEGEFATLYDIIDAQPNATRLILRAAAEAALACIQETHFICERGPTIDYSSDTVQVADSWAGQVDRQGGSFTDREIIDRITW